MKRMTYKLYITIVGLILLGISPLIMAENTEILSKESTNSERVAKDDHSDELSIYKGLSADEHGWEPNSTPSIADKSLLLFPDLEEFVIRCRDADCQYDEANFPFKGIKLIGDFGLLEVLKHEDGRPWITVVNEFNGEWVIINPIRETDMTMDCVRVGTMAHQGQDENTATDSICSIKGANGYTLEMAEVLEAWVVDRNIEISNIQIKSLSESRKAHLKTMGPDTDTEEGKRVFNK